MRYGTAAPVLRRARVLLLLIFDLEFDVPVKRDNGEGRKLSSSFFCAELGFFNHVIFVEGTFVSEQEARLILVKCVETTFWEISFMT